MEFVCGMSHFPNKYGKVICTKKLFIEKGIEEEEEVMSIFRNAMFGYEVYTGLV